MPGPIDEADRQRSALMVAAQAGDRSAYEALLRGCVPMIKSVAYRQGVPRDGIDDVVQETLLTVHRARQTYDPNRPFSAWLTTIAHRRHRCHAPPRLQGSAGTSRANHL